MLPGKLGKKQGAQKLPLRPTIYRSHSPPSSQRFDAESGQVYIETEVRVSSRQRSDWIGELKTPDQLQRELPNSHGARSLLDMAKRRTARSFRDLTSDHFAAVPWKLASKVWDEVLLIRAESFHTWRTLAKSYSNGFEFGKPAYRYHLEIRQPSLPLQDYYTGISSDAIHWLTCIRIAPKYTSKADLVALANIKNLAVLDLSDGQSRIDNNVSNFDERIMRTWAELASTGNSFRHLRVMMFGWQENLSVWIFNYIDHFPDLRYIVLTDCPHMHQKNRPDWEPLASLHGWEARYSKRSAKTLRPILDDKAFHMGAISGLYYETLDMGLDEAVDQANKVKKRLPILECWIGTPKRWQHVLDEFPSHRSIFFEKLQSFAKPVQIDLVASATTDHVKRTRQQQEHLPSETRSPPPKRIFRTAAKVKSNAKDVENLLEEFGVG